MKIYTKTGDKGLTGLIDGKRIPKSDIRIIAYGSIDELNSYIGLSISLLSQNKTNNNNNNQSFSDIIITLNRIQNELFIIGSDLADPDLSKSTSLRVQSTMITVLENDIDNYQKELSPITYFILPGGSVESSTLHIARSITRRAETNVSKLLLKDIINNLVLIYLNRLSDLLFVLSRTVNQRLQILDIAWKS
ncbi:MAG TPA: cob(I)yrinic acid a,c-diamide adenosyltransferase [Nitrososphaeraceae archaeon]|jgi:cob(I)alamin adenosyltransferase|nr:cob(I)yrinic acid a,c-diamide adenosyltransferase [Nitrososphaeraceae archaeon]